MKWMEISLKKYIFLGQNRIGVLDFLELFVKEANIQGVSEDHAFITLLSSLEGLSPSQD